MFNLFIDDDNFLIIRNTLTTTTIRISKKIKRNVDNLLSSTDYKNPHNQNNPASMNKIIKTLIDKNILVDLSFDEKKQYKELFLNHRQEDDIFAIYIATTTNCQLNCPYCFEGIQKREENITTIEADEIVLWTSKYLEQNTCNKLRVILYGGEPLLNKKIVRYLLPKLKEVADNKKILFETGILTNGELLDYETGEFLHRHNINKIQITLDGPKRCHDSRRHHKKDKKGTFDKIISNILCLLGNNLVEQIDLRINFDKQNIDFIPELFDLLLYYRIEKKINLSFGIITPTIPTNIKNYFQENTLGQIRNAEKYLWLCSEAKKRGFSIPKEFMAGPWCTARKIHSTVILPKGNMLKCISLVGNNDFFFGNIKNCDTLEDDKFTNFEYIDTCLSNSCSLIPICGGGCRFEAYLSTGSFSKPHCQRKMIETINKGLIILNYK
ncbi:MAG: radical SAM protein [Candidatus Pacebacteria bacterium]|nr:radical SAM protein [Candidatus Paceibacterota bacterium]